MKLTTKRNRWYFWRELFSYMIPMILIVGTVDVFYHFMQCPLHPEWSAPCNVIWILAGMYGFFLLLTIILAIISSKMLRKVKKQIENEFTEAVNDNAKEQVKEEKVKTSKPKKTVAKAEEKSENKKVADKKVSKKTTTKRTTVKK